MTQTQGSDSSAHAPHAIRSRHIGLALLGLVMTGLGIYSFTRWRTVNHDLTAKPTRSSTNAPIPASVSSLQLSASVPYSTVASALANSIPAEFSDSGRQNVCVDVNEQVQQTIQSVAPGGDIGNFLGKAVGAVTKIVTQVVTLNQLRHVCQDVDYRVNIRRDGAPTAGVSPSGSSLRITVPISISGEVGFSGDLAKALAMDKKSFRGSIIAFVDVSGDLGTDWCPTVQANADFAWTDKASLEIVHNVWISIDGSTGPKIRDALTEAAKKLPAAVNCSQVKAAILPTWHSYSWPINNDKSVLAYVNLTPTAAGFSGLKYGPDCLRFAIELKATTEISSAPSHPPAIPSVLPALNRIGETSDTLRLSLPLRGRYSDLTHTLQPFLTSRDFAADSPAGRATVHIREVTVYPSGNSLVVGVNFNANFPHRLERVSGWVYVLGDPVLDEKSQTLKLHNVRFTRDIDNSLWKLVSAVFQGPIQQAIEQEAYLDLREPIRALRVRARNDLTKSAADQGIQLSLSDSFIGLKQVNLTNDAIEILVGLEGTGDVTVMNLKP
jgi:hypothetical protein